jgi:hypothetical protein
VVLGVGAVGALSDGDVAAEWKTAPTPSRSDRAAVQVRYYFVLGTHLPELNRAGGSLVASISFDTIAATTRLKARTRSQTVVAACSPR